MPTSARSGGYSRRAFQRRRCWSPSRSGLGKYPSRFTSPRSAGCGRIDTACYRAARSRLRHVAARAAPCLRRCWFCSPGEGVDEAAQGHDAVLRRGAEGSGVKDCILALALDDFLRLDIPPRETILAPWLPRCGLAMIHAPRGLGKTQVAIGTAWAMASGGGFLRWRCDNKAWRVLFLDGEMPGADLQSRFKCVTTSS